MRLLVLGGTRFVGRAVIANALNRGWDVTALHRGLSGELPPDVTPLIADRSNAVELAAALAPASQRWDAVVDTWSGAPQVATTAARLLADRAGRYSYVSSGSVYVWGRHLDESSPVVDGDPQATEGEYAALKRGAELGILDPFPDALLARAGLILGPYEDIGRLPWWLTRLAAGGRVVAPGRPARPLQYVDARDLADWLLEGLASGVAGPVDIVGPSGHATTRSLLEACIATTGADAELVWCSEAQLAAVGAQPWTQLPCWVPEDEEFAGFFELPAARAAATGLGHRPIGETVVDTWSWLQRDGPTPQRDDRPVHGLPPELERRLLVNR